MKSTIVRLSVLALSVTGFAATTFVAKAAPKTHKIQPVAVGNTCTPTCNPFKSACGVD